MPIVSNFPGGRSAPENIVTVEGGGALQIDQVLGPGPYTIEFTGESGSNSIISSFNGRTGEITPASGDYTAEMVGAVPVGRKVNGKALSGDITLSASDVSAVPTTRRINNKSLGADISLSASDVGAVTMAQVTTAIQNAIQKSWEASY